MTAWPADEIATLRAEFPSTTTRDLARKLGRSPKSISAQAAHLGLSKTFEHRSEHSRKTALMCDFSPEHMAKIGSRGGLIGGPARAAKLAKKRRIAIAKNAVLTRWRRAKKP